MSPEPRHPQLGGGHSAVASANHGRHLRSPQGLPVSPNWARSPVTHFLTSCPSPNHLNSYSCACLVRGQIPAPNRIFGCQRSLQCSRNICRMEEGANARMSCQGTMSQGSPSSYLSHRRATRNTQGDQTDAKADLSCKWWSSK